MDRKLGEKPTFYQNIFIKKLTDPLNIITSLKTWGKELGGELGEKLRLITLIVIVSLLYKSFV